MKHFSNNNLSKFRDYNSSNSRHIMSQFDETVNNNQYTVKYMIFKISAR